MANVIEKLRDRPRNDHPMDTYDKHGYTKSLVSDPI